MRKERLIVPLVVGLALLWAVAQYAASLLFERELVRMLNDLEARGELVVERVAVERGWLSSSGRVVIAPLLGDDWQLAFTYSARHGVLSTRLEGELHPTLGSEQQRLFGDALPSSAPRWHARYQTLWGALEGSIGLAPFVIRQGERELDFQGGQVTFGGEYGDWWLRARLKPLRLSDSDATLEAGPSSLESRYAYTDGAYHFIQHDLLHLESLSWRQPGLELDASELLYRNRMQLDDNELRIAGELVLGQLMTAEQMLLTGRIQAQLSRLHAGALRTLLSRLREEVMMGGSGTPTPRELIERLEPEFKAVLQDSPRLDISEVDLESPMLGVSAQGEGVLIFDPRRLDELRVSRLDAPDEQARWRRRLDGDFVWHDVPTVVALWLGLPFSTQELVVDVIRGRVRVNGRPLPPLWR